MNKLQSSPYSRSDVCDIIRSLIVHFESGRKMKKSLNQTVEPNLLPSCDHEGNDISSMTTTIGNLRSDGVNIDAEENIADLSAIESQNRKINDRVALAVSLTIRSFIIHERSPIIGRWNSKDFEV